jgi:colicin import membrane protein
MQSTIKNKLFSFIFSVLIHATALFIIVLTFDLQGTQVMQADSPDQEIIQGMLVNETIMNQEIKRVVEEREDVRIAEEQARIEVQNRERERLEEFRRYEQQRQDDARIAEENERSRLQQIQREEAQQVERVQRQRQAELDRQKIVEEARMQAAMQERERLFEEARANAEARALQQRQALENQRRLSEIEQERNAWMRLIQLRIRQVWRSPGAVDDVLCRLLVTLIPSGEVVGVTVQECNASDQIILSVERAVRQASPLPLPHISSVFERQIELDFIIEKQ